MFLYFLPVNCVMLHTVHLYFEFYKVYIYIFLYFLYFFLLIVPGEVLIFLCLDVLLWPQNNVHSENIFFSKIL